MPFTPIHMGPGMMVKAAVPRRFSIVVFGLTQIALDLEVLWYLVRGTPPLFRFWHTYLGATLVVLFFAVLGKPAGQLITSIWNHIARRCQDADLSVPVHTSWTATVLAAIVGSYSHIVLDSLFHPNIEPFQPWSAGNPLFGIIGPTMVQIGCIVFGILGLAWFFHREIKSRKANQKVEPID